MFDSLLQNIPALLAVFAVAGILGWLLRGLKASRRQEKISDEWEIKFDETARQRDRFNAENNKLRDAIEAQQALMAKHEQAAQRSRTELESAREKIKLLGKDNFTISAERDDFKNSSLTHQNALNVANRQIGELEAEFVKAGEFYKGELEKALEKRKALELKIDDARHEHESLSNLLEASRSEHDSVKKMLASAQTRLANIDELENSVIELEADNAQLRHDATLARQEVDALRRDVAELEELKIQNKELAHCLTSMENSRKQYEVDAKRYREQADQSEKRSETLLLKLDDVEKSFSEMARQHDEALKVVQHREPAQAGNGNVHEDSQSEVDDLTQIVGIGKVFQQTLHKLGVFSFRQIAAFGPSDIARVNMELKEFKGRMEQDDWIGQAKELHFKKYGDSGTTH
ncbi:MAG: hypothetical protein KJO82_11180 [Gammaproteobacteria bacterium]|nr:hypothetical protein [Gammaproteobacteria bacterium]